MISFDMPELTGGASWWADGQVQSIKVNSGYGSGYLSHVSSFQSGISIVIQNFSLYGEGKIRLFSGEKVNPPVITFPVCFSGVRDICFAKARVSLGGKFSYIEIPGCRTNISMDVNSNTPVRSLAVCMAPDIFKKLTGKSGCELAESIALLDWSAGRPGRPKRLETLDFAQKLCCCEIFDSFMNNPRDILFLEAKAMELIALQLRQLDYLTGKYSQRRVSSGHAHKIRYASEIMRNEMANPPKKKELARRVGISDKKLIQGFKDIFGVCPSEYLRTQRLEKARDLIAGHECNVTEAAFTVGYSSLSHFTKTFRAKFGVNPKALAKKTVG